jgi:hypothetical protein
LSTSDSCNTPKKPLSSPLLFSAASAQRTKRQLVAHIDHTPRLLLF